MLDPRIYRTGMVFVLLAAILVAFSLRDQQPAASTTDVPDAFNGATAYAQMRALAAEVPLRDPGGEGDDALASVVARELTADGFQVSEVTDRVQTAGGTRTLVRVVATRAGLLPGSIVIVAPRDPPGLGGLSATAAMLELARVLSGGTQRHQIVLASISGSAGVAGASRLAASLPGPVDAVIGLGDLDALRVRGPVVVPFSDRVGFAPPRLRNTVGDALAGEGAPHGVSPGFGLQFAHLALPVATTLEAPFNGLGVPAVDVTLDGGVPPAQEALAGPARLSAVGRGVLRAVDALDADGTLPPPAAYLLIKGKLLPEWAFRLLILAALFPILAVALDGAARASRRGYPVLRWLGVLLARGLPPAVSVAVVVLARSVGYLHAPPGLLGPGEVAGSSRIAVVLLVALALGASMLVAVRLVARLPRPPVRRGEAGSSPEAQGWRNPGALAAVLIALCALSIAIWSQNPFAAALLVPALHLWAWNMDPDLALPRGVRVILCLAGLIAPVLVLIELARATGLGPGGVITSGILLIAGGGLGFVTLLEWCALATCITAAIACAVGRESLPAAAPVARNGVRGPAGYAGPGSLGGTGSALRR